MFTTESIDDQLTKLSNTSKVLNNLLAEINKIRSDIMKDILNDDKEISSKDETN